MPSKSDRDDDAEGEAGEEAEWAEEIVSGGSEEDGDDKVAPDAVAGEGLGGTKFVVDPDFFVAGAMAARAGFRAVFEGSSAVGAGFHVVN